jgi:hypothetical protein
MVEGIVNSFFIFCSSEARTENKNIEEKEAKLLLTKHHFYSME